MKKLIMSIIALAFMASCTDDVIQSDFSEKGLVVKPKISVTFDSLLCDQSDATRASINITGNGKMFSTVLNPDNDDMYGITDTEGTINIPASVTGKGENQTLDLDIIDDGLSVGKKYILYYPYNDSFLKRTSVLLHGA